MIGRIFLRSPKALVKVTLSDSFRFRRRFRFFSGDDYLQAPGRARDRYTPALITVKSRISDPVVVRTLGDLLHSHCTRQHAMSRT